MQTFTDLATRVYNHGFRLDPIIRSLLDTDFYKLLMLQLIWRQHADTRVTFALHNRDTRIRLAEEIDEGELRAQLDHARTLRFTKKELIWLAGNSFYGRARMFSPEFLHFLGDFQLGEYELRQADGQYELRFDGPWTQTTMWEIPALAIVSELRARAALADRGRFALDVLYARAKARLWDKIERLRAIPDLQLSDFGTRRRHSFLWQRWCVEALRERLGPHFTGTSNVLLAMDADLEAIGTNAHELPMVQAALATTDAERLHAPYAVLEEWQQQYGGNLRIVLPDTFGTTHFLRHAPDWVADWTGFRPDSLPPIEAGEQILAWWQRRGRDPRTKLLIFSDAMDVDSMLATHAHFAGRVRIGFGWGTNLTNDFRGCDPDGGAGLHSFSLVCKVVAVNGRPAVKLSDNPLKANGPAAEIARYRDLFDAHNQKAHPVLV